MAGMYPDNQNISLFGKEINWPGVDQETGKFTNGDFNNPLKKPSFIPAETINLILDNLASLIVSLGKNPNNTGPDQLKEAIVDALALKANNDAITAALTLKAPLTSPVLTGTPTAPTPAVGDNTTKIATMAAIIANVSNSLTDTSTTKALSAAQGKALQDAKANLASPALTGTPTAPTPAAKTNNTQIATTAYADRAAHPVNSYYIQFPVSGQSTFAGMFPASESPATLFGGTWTVQYDTEEVSFRTPGTGTDTSATRLGANRGKQWNNAAKAFETGTAGIEPDAVRNAAGYFAGLGSDGDLFLEDNAWSQTRSGTIYNSYIFELKSILFDLSRAVPTGTTNRVKNRLIRVWKKTA